MPAYKQHDFVRMTISNTGTGALTLNAAVASYFSFAGGGVANNEVVSYYIIDGANREWGRGTYKTATTSIQRTTILGSTNAGAAINCTATAEVWLGPLAADFNQTYTLNRTAAGTDQTSATVATAGFNEFTNVAAGKTAKLSTVGGIHESIIANFGANNLTFYPGSSGTINNLPANTPVILPPGSVTRFTNVAANKWYGVINRTASVADFGAVGDGTTDDEPIITTAIKAVYAAGGGVLTFDGSKNYKIGKTLFILPGVSLDGNGTTISLASGYVFIVNPSYIWDGSQTALFGTASDGHTELARTTLTSDVTAGSNTITVTDASAFTVGANATVRAGTNLVDTNEVLLAQIGKIVSKTSTTITFDIAFTRDVSIAGASPNGLEVVQQDWYYADAFIKNLNLECLSSADIQGGIWLNWARNILIENVTGNKLGGTNMGSGLVTGFDCDNVLVRKCRLYRNEHTWYGTTGQLSKGRFINWGTSRNCRDEDCLAENLWGSYAYWEFACEGCGSIGAVVRNGNARGAVDYALIGHTFGVNNYVRDITVEYNATYVFDDTGGNGGTLHLDGVRIIGAWPTNLGEGTTVSISGVVSYDSGKGDSFSLNFDAAYYETFSHRVGSNTYEASTLGPGMCTELQCFGSSTLANFAAFWGTTAFSGALNISTKCTPGHLQTQLPNGGIFGVNCPPHATVAQAKQSSGFIETYGKHAPDPDGVGYIFYRVKIVPFIATNTNAHRDLVMTDAQATDAFGRPKMISQVIQVSGTPTSVTIPGGYRVGNTLVFKNGTMVPVDGSTLTASNGTTITFGSALTNGDKIAAIQVY